MNTSTPQTSTVSTKKKRKPPKRRRKVTGRKGKKVGIPRPGPTFSFDELRKRKKEQKEFKKETRRIRRNYGKLQQTAVGLFTREEVEEMAREVGFYRRSPREISAFKFVLCTALAAVLEQKRSFAAVWRLMIAAAGKRVARSAVTQRFGAGSAKLMEKLVTRVFERVTSLRNPEMDRRLEEFRAILANDGSVVTLSPLFQKIFPARHTSKGGAAVRIHGTADVLHRRLVRVVVTGDRDSELAVARSIPPEKGYLYINDLGYLSYSYFEDIKKSGADLLSRLKSNSNPKIVGIREGFRNPKYVVENGMGLNDPMLPKFFLKSADVFDVDALFDTGEEKVEFRVIGVYDSENECYHKYVTTLSLDEFTPREISQLYRYRWIIELLFKLLKSSCHMDHVDTSNIDALRTHIYSSILAALILYEVGNESARIGGFNLNDLSYLVTGVASPIVVIPLLLIWFERDITVEELLDLVLRVITIGCRDQNPKRTRKQWDVQEGW